MRRVLPEAEGILHSFTASSAVGAVRPQGQRICSPGAAALLLSLENDDSLGLVQRLDLVYCLQASRPLYSNDLTGEALRVSLKQGVDNTL